MKLNIAKSILFYHRLRWIKLILIVIGGFFICSLVKSGLSIDLPAIMNQRTERKSTFSCTESTCIFTDVCLDNQGLIHYYSNDRVDLPVVNLIGASHEWNSFRSWADTRYVIDPLETKEHLTVRTPVLFQKMIAMGNFGHGMLQNVMPALAMILKHPHLFPDPHNAQVVMLNDCKNW